MKTVPTGKTHLPVSAGPALQLSVLVAEVQTPSDTTYRVFAFRKLTELEMVQAVKLYLAQPKILRLKHRERNKTVTTDSLQGSEINFAAAL